MLKVKETYISIKDIRSIKYKAGLDIDNDYLIILYLDGCELRIKVKNFEEYEDLANSILMAVNLNERRLIQV